MSESFIAVIVAGSKEPLVNEPLASSRLEKVNLWGR